MSFTLPFNSHFYPVLESKKLYKLIYGGRGSGKSFFVALSFIYKMLQPHYFRGILARAVSSDIRDSQYQEIIDIIEDLKLSDFFIMRSQKMEIECTLTGNKCFAKGLRKDSGNRTAKVKSIKDPTDVWIEEADEISEDDFIKMDTSIRTVKGESLHIWMTFNPENEDHWICKRWFNEDYSHKEDEDTIINHSTYKINTSNLKKSYIRKLYKLRESSPEFATVYIDGKWGGGKRGRVYKEFKIISDTEFDAIQGYTTWGVDFGYNDPMVLTECKLYDGQLYFKEHYYETEKQIEDLIKFMDDNEISTFDPIYCDASRPDNIRALQLAGYNAQKAKKDIMAGIQTVKSFPINITQSSKNGIREMKKYVWIIDAKTSKPLDKPVDLDNHFCDTKRYCTFSDNNIRVYHAA